ncbi:hypothetical protein WIW50_18755 [Flavobacteriaceae bacterium 3-367]|uniref:hypothetical protein n=1 Tax=Eudoraea algarum TaxID=3417568 RepID=UPI00326C9487
METFFIVLFILIGINALLLTFSINTGKVERTVEHTPEVDCPSQVQAPRNIRTELYRSSHSKKSCKETALVSSEWFYAPGLDIPSKSTVKSPISHLGDDGE